jgi:hypothetical protein
MHPSLNAEDLPKRPSRASLRGLDWFTFFVADIQTGFGPFIAVYLTTQKWTLADIGLVLTIGGLVSLIEQMPGGAVVDAVRSVRRAAASAVIGIGVSALVLALWPIFIIVVAARVLHTASSCVLGPAIHGAPAGSATSNLENLPSQSRRGGSSLHDPTETSAASNAPLRG